MVGFKGPSVLYGQIQPCKYRRAVGEAAAFAAEVALALLLRRRLLFCLEVFVHIAFVH